MRLRPFVLAGCLGAAMLGAVGSALKGAPQGGDPVVDPLSWPEEERAFYQDGPGLLLSPDDKSRFVALDSGGRQQFIRDFMSRDPIPETTLNELAVGIAARQKLAAADYNSPQDVRAQLLFLLGRPAEKQTVDCPVAFKPLEIWTYRDGDLAKELLLYRPSTGDPYRLWIPLDSKRALYTSDMEFWLDQWERDRQRGKRVDIFFCPAAERVDRVTGIEGLRGKVVATVSRTVATPSEVHSEERKVRWVRPKDRAALLAAPKDLAAWAKLAAAGPLPIDAPPLTLGDVLVDFPRWQGSRLVSRGVLTLPSSRTLQPVATDGRPRLNLVLEGLLDQEGVAFDAFRVRYRLPVPTAEATPQPLALSFERPLRPGQAFVLRLRIRDEGSGAVGTLARAFRVPGTPVARWPEGSRPPGATGELDGLSASGPDRVVLLPPPEEVVLGVWRAEAIVTGERIRRVVFAVDGEEQMTRSRPPFSAEVRLPLFPHETVVRAQGFDERGDLIATDQVVLNRTEGGFHVLITDPPIGRTVHGRLKARAEVTLPEEGRLASVEFRVNDRSVATLKGPPWEAEIEVPESEPLAYLTVVARLDDGASTEGVRVLRAPANFSEVNVDLVELFVAVLGGDGHPKLGLAASDFEILEEGKSKSIARFEQVENLPLSVGVAFDTSFSMAASLGEAKRAAASFLTNLVTPRDRCFALTFGGRPEILVPLVDDASLVAESLNEVKAFGRTALYDGIVASLYLFRAQRGQRALVLLTDGEDTVSGISRENAMEYAERSGVAIYTVGLGISELKRGIRSELADFAARTGGRSFFISRAEELSAVYGQIGEELRSRYLLAYSSDLPTDAEGRRKVEVRSKRGKVRVSRAAAL